MRGEQDGATVSDILRVTTKHPVVEYLPGGSIYMQRLKRKWRLRTVMKLALFFFVLSAVLYVLWLVPGERTGSSPALVMYTNTNLAWP